MVPTLCRVKAVEHNRPACETAGGTGSLTSGGLYPVSACFAFVNWWALLDSNQ
jgi:hypothetical protein